MECLNVQYRFQMSRKQQHLRGFSCTDMLPITRDKFPLTSSHKWFSASITPPPLGHMSFKPKPSPSLTGGTWNGNRSCTCHIIQYDSGVERLGYAIAVPLTKCAGRILDEGLFWNGARPACSENKSLNTPVYTRINIYSAIYVYGLLCAQINPSTFQL